MQAVAQLAIDILAKALVEEFARVVLWLCVRFLHIDHC